MFHGLLRAFTVPASLVWTIYTYNILPRLPPRDNRGPGHTPSPCVYTLNFYQASAYLDKAIDNLCQSDTHASCYCTMMTGLQAKKCKKNHAKTCRIKKSVRSNEPHHEKTNVLVSDTNQAVQLQKMVGGLKFQI